MPKFNSAWNELISHIAHVFSQFSCCIQCSLKGCPMFPAVTASTPYALRADFNKLTTVVLPLVPVTPITFPLH